MEKQLQEKFTTIAQNQNAIKELGVNEGIGLGIKEAAANSKYIEKRVSGSVISLNDVSEVYHKVKVYGDNCAVKVYGKNLLPYPYHSKTLTTEGITFTDNGDGTITANGTAIANAYFLLTVDSFPAKANEQYILSGCPAGGSNSTYMLYSQSLGATDFGDGAISTILTEDKSVSIAIRVFKGTTVSNVTFTPIICLANTHQTITATPTGTEIDSMCPNMNFMADGELDICVEYYSSFGMQTEYDRFWDVYQNKGNRTDYGSAFQSWEGAIFKPKYDIMPVGACGSLFLKSQILDIRKSLKDCGVILDTSRATTLSYLVHNSTTKSLPKIDMSLCASSSSLQSSFTSATKLEIIEELVSSENTLFHTNTFQNCTSLTHCIFSGVIANDINLQWSPLLDDESLISLIATLKWYESVDDGYMSKTITLHTDVWAKADAINTFGTIWTEQGDLFMSLTEFVDTKGWKRA